MSRMKKKIKMVSKKLIFLFQLFNCTMLYIAGNGSRDQNIWSIWGALRAPPDGPPGVARCAPSKATRRFLAALVLSGLGINSIEHFMVLECWHVWAS